MEKQTTSGTPQTIHPEAGACYGAGWQRLWNTFPEMLLVILISFIVAIPASGLSVAAKEGGIIAFYFGMMVLAYAVLFLWPIEYGVSYAFLKAARGDRVEIRDMFDVFKNYANAILAHLLVSFIVGIGIFLFFIPGIVFACKLAFVPYLIVDRKMEAIEAVQASWRMTTGHTFTIFLIGLISGFISIAGLICFFVGVVPAAMWIKLTFAAMYIAVTEEKEIL